jgi:hypothetical protein
LLPQFTLQIKGEASRDGVAVKQVFHDHDVFHTTAGGSSATPISTIGGRWAASRVPPTPAAADTNGDLVQAQNLNENGR